MKPQAEPKVPCEHCKKLTKVSALVHWEGYYQKQDRTYAYVRKDVCLPCRHRLAILMPL